MSGGDNRRAQGHPATGDTLRCRRRRQRPRGGLAYHPVSIDALDERADATAIRTRYAEMVKRWHPDSNGGDRGAEAQLQRVIKAYQTLKAAGLV